MSMDGRSGRAVGEKKDNLNNNKKDLYKLFETEGMEQKQ